MLYSQYAISHQKASKCNYEIHPVASPASWGELLLKTPDPLSRGITETGLSCLFQTHLPGYVEDYEKIKAKGVDIIACVSVNDAFVMEAWGESKGATGKIRMLADPAGEFTKVRLLVQALY